MRTAFQYTLALFGILTLLLSSAILFDLFSFRDQVGNYVLSVVWANFISSLIYLFIAYYYFKIKKWSGLLLVISAVILIIAFISLKIHINLGGIFETKIIGALYFRIYFTLILSFIAYMITGNLSKISTN